MDDVVPGAASVPAKTVEINQVGAAKTTPRRAMDDATADVAAGSVKPATDVQADAADEGRPSPSCWARRQSPERLRATPRLARLRL